MRSKFSGPGARQTSTLILLVSYLGLCSITWSVSAFVSLHAELQKPASLGPRSPGPEPLNSAPQSPQPGPAGAGTPQPNDQLTLYDVFDVATGNDPGSCDAHRQEIVDYFAEVKDIVTRTVDDLHQAEGHKPNRAVQNALKSFMGINFDVTWTGIAGPADIVRFLSVNRAYDRMSRFLLGQDPIYSDLPQPKSTTPTRPGMFCNDDWLVETDVQYEEGTGIIIQNSGYTQLLHTTHHPTVKAFWSHKYKAYDSRDARICNGNTLGETFLKELRSVTFCPMQFTSLQPAKLIKKHYPPPKDAQGRLNYAQRVLLRDIVPRSVTLLHELDHLVRPESDDVAYWGPPTGQLPNHPSTFIDHSPLQAISVVKCMYTAQAQPDLAVLNSESMSLLGLTILLSESGNDFSTGQAMGLNNHKNDKDVSPPGTKKGPRDLNGQGLSTRQSHVDGIRVVREFRA